MSGDDTHSPARPVADPVGTATTALVTAAFRQNQEQGGADYARSQLIAALAGCALFSMELDGLAATLALLADAARIMELGYGNSAPAQRATVH